MTCCYPNCRQPALWTPVVEVPTLRSVGDNVAMVKTTRPTVLLCREVCQHHRDLYVLSDWINATDWAYIQEAAIMNGLVVPEMTVIPVTFRPIDWHPGHGYLELGRT